MPLGIGYCIRLNEYEKKNRPLHLSLNLWFLEPPTGYIGTTQGTQGSLLVPSPSLEQARKVLDQNAHGPHFDS